MMHLPSKTVLLLGHIFLLLFSANAFSASTEDQLKKLDLKIIASPSNPQFKLQKAELLFETNQHLDAIEIYDELLATYPELIDAYFGRGMARGRAGYIKDGIDDLSIYLKHKPNSSLAFTKRGVRYLWLGDMDNAKKDFLSALQIDPTNAEAHDDIGVIYAQQNQPEKAIKHFRNTIKYDVSYQKAYHNLALTYFIYDNSQAALEAVNKALVLSPESKGTLILKSEILKSLGMITQAKALKQEAEFLPDGNWSESLAIE